MSSTAVFVALLYVTSSTSALMTSALTVDKRGPGDCTNPIPGSDKLMQGVDLTRLDIYNRRSFKRSVLAKTCFNQKKTGWNDKKEYDVPDQIQDWINNPEGTFSTETTVMETLSDVSKSFALSISVEGSYGPVSGSASTSYSKMSRDIAENKYMYSTVEATLKTTTVMMKLPGNKDMKMSADANRTLPWGYDYSSANHKKYTYWIGRYGTHFFEHGYFGAVIRMEAKTSSSMAKKYSKEELKVAASMAYNGLFSSFKIDVSVGIASSSMTSDFNSHTSTTLKFYGGDTNLLADEALKEWQPTVRTNPYLRGGKLAPIYELIEDHHMRSQMEQAVDAYLTATYKKNLKKRIKEFVGTFRHSRRQEILQDLNTFVDGLDQNVDSMDYIQEEFDDIMQKINEITQYKGECSINSDCHFKEGACVEGRCRCNVDHVYDRRTDVCKKECSVYGSEFVKYPGQYYVYQQNWAVTVKANNPLITNKDGIQDEDPVACKKSCLEDRRFECLSFGIRHHVPGSLMPDCRTQGFSVPKGGRLGYTTQSNEDYYQRQCA